MVILNNFHVKPLCILYNTVGVSVARMQSFFKEKRMKSILMAAIVVVGASFGANAHEPVRVKAEQSPACECVQCRCRVCHCGPFIIKRHYVGRGVWNYSKGVTGRAWTGLKTFVTAPFKEPFVVPQRQYLVSPGYYTYHPGWVRPVRPVPQIPRTNLGAPAPPEH